MNKDITDDLLNKVLETIRQREIEADNVPDPHDMFIKTLILEIKARGRLLTDARALDPLRWVAGRCGWCCETKDGHGEKCPWPAFIKSTESLHGL